MVYIVFLRLLHAVDCGGYQCKNQKQKTTTSKLLIGFESAMQKKLIEKVSEKEEDMGNNLCWCN